MPSEPSKGAVEAATELIPSGCVDGDTWHRRVYRAAEIIQRLAVDPAVAARDVEWCKMLGFEEAGDVGNTPEFMERELDAMEEYDARDHIRCRNRLAAAEAELARMRDRADRLEIAISCVLGCPTCEICELGKAELHVALAASEPK